MEEKKLKTKHGEDRADEIKNAHCSSLFFQYSCLHAPCYLLCGLLEKDDCLHEPCREVETGFVTQGGIAL